MRRQNRILRRTGAVLAGVLVIIILSIAMDTMTHASGVFPPFGQPMADALFVVALTYRSVFSVAGSYIAARLAPYRSMQHALTVGAVGLGLSVLGAALTRGRGPEFGPLWYPVALLVLAMPCAWAGGRLREMQLRALV